MEYKWSSAWYDRDLYAKESENDQPNNLTKDVIFKVLSMIPYPSSYSNYLRNESIVMPRNN